MEYKDFSDSQFILALQQRDDLLPFNENKIAAFAIELCFSIDDPIATLLPAVTGGGGDAKIDMLFVSRELGIIVVCQAYQSEKMRKSARGNKGTDLNLAMSVLLSVAEKQLPEGVAPHIIDAREAIISGDIRAIHVWYVHNCPESQTIQNDMAMCVPGTRVQLDLYGENAKNISLQYKEIGLESLDDFYRASTQSIAVSEMFVFDEPRKGFLIEHKDWHTFITTIPGAWLAKLYKEYVNRGLYNSNVRGFMGANNKDSEKIINAGIQTSAMENPDDFFVYNNGITALVHDFQLNDNNDLISIKGIGIVNGAQTTGSLGELGYNIDLSKINVGVRFIKCENKETVKLITKYNNSQNKVIQSDFRANDPIQTRLREEFRKNRIAEYKGGLRGHEFNDKKNKIDAHTAAQALTAWHGNPYDSYHNKMQIWESDEHYKKAFNELISSQHILFIYSLNEAANLLKSELQEQAKSNKLKETEYKLLNFLNQRGSAFMTTHAMKGLVESIMTVKILSPYKIGFAENVKKDEACELWKKLLTMFSKFIDILLPGVSGRLSNKTAISSAKEEFVRSAGTTAEYLKDLAEQDPFLFFIEKIDNSI